MTVIELIGGLTFVNKPVKLWDYSNEWGNYKGIICPLFSFVWTVIGAIYYYVLAGFILDKLEWFNNNLSFSFILGLFSGIIIIDFFYSNKILSKIRKYAADNNIEVRYEELKTQIREFEKQRERKHTFMFTPNPSLDLKEYVKKYRKVNKKAKKRKK